MQTTATSIEEGQSTRMRSPFWVFQVTGWSLLFLSTLAVNIIRGNNHWTTVMLAFIVAAAGFGATSLFRTYIKRGQYDTVSLRKVFVPLIIGSLVVSIIWSLPLLLAQFIIDSSLPEHSVGFDQTTVWLTALNNFFVVLLWAILYFAWHYFRIAQVARMERYKSDMAMRDAQLNTLKGQINPHFMFNSLNNIRALMLEDVSRSREMITKLSDLLRYSMSITEKREVPLTDEIKVVQDFLQLCEIQYEDKLRYSIDVASDLENARIPPMVIQMLVENSVKHGVAALPGGGDVAVRVSKNADHIAIEVGNSGIWSTQSGSKRENNGIGLANVRRRLNLLYGDSATFHIREENNRVIARIEIPLKTWNE